jgi:hypothetical protein
MKVVAGVARDRVRQRAREAGLAEALDPPRDQSFSLSGRSHLSL